MSRFRTAAHRPGRFSRGSVPIWAFGGHGVMPEILVMAKGIGNGFLLGAMFA